MARKRINCRSYNCDNKIEWRTSFFESCGVCKHILKSGKWEKLYTSGLSGIFKEIYGGDALKDLIPKGTDLLEWLKK